MNSVLYDLTEHQLGYYINAHRIKCQIRWEGTPCSLPLKKNCLLFNWTVPFSIQPFISSNNQISGAYRGLSPHCVLLQTQWGPQIPLLQNVYTSFSINSYYCTCLGLLSSNESFFYTDWYYTYVHEWYDFLYQCKYNLYLISINANPRVFFM